MQKPLFSQDILELINQYREESGLNTLHISTNLVDSANNHLNYLIDEGVISHTGKGGSTLKERVDISGVTGLNFGEIVGFSGSNSELLTSWKSSPTHNSVVLDPKWTFIGVSRRVFKNRVVSVVNFSTGLLGSVDIVKHGNITTVSGTFIDSVIFDSRVKFEIIKQTNGLFEFRISNQSLGFFIKAFNKDGKLTDRINIF